MLFKQYLTWVAQHVKPDSDRPTDMVQSLACLIASRLSVSGKLPIACGMGDNLDMDIVQAGILAGLEKIASYDSALGTMRQYLYPTIAGAMQGYAWERENRVADSRPDVWPEVLSIQDGDSWPPQGGGGEYSDQPKAQDAALITSATPETALMEEEDAKTAYKAITAAIAGLGTDDVALLLRDAQIGYNAAKRQQWADELGISLGALSMRLSRLRKAAREWALNVQ